MKTKSFKFLLIFIILSLFTKTDYRLDTGIYCCKDDHDYYAHAETLAVDFDFDYSNQFLGKEFQRFNYKENRHLQLSLEAVCLLLHFYL